MITSCALVACAGSEPDPLGGKIDVLPTGDDCISKATVRDYRVLDEENLVVTASAKRKYHIQLSSRAYGLSGSWHIGFKTYGMRICPGASDVVFEDNMGGDTIRIKSIRELTPPELDELLVHFGKKEPEELQTPAPEQVEGAEVEELD